MGLTAARQDSEVLAEINITPLTDVLLVLLIIFMILTALAAPPGFQKQLPKKSNTPTNITQDVLKHQIDVEVGANNRIFIDSKPVTMANLYNAMADAVKFHKQHAAEGFTTHVSLLADAKASYNTIIKILDAAREAGDDDVGFVTE